MIKNNAGIICLVLALALTAVQADYTVTTSCSPSTCFIDGQFCSNCVYFNGGPFSNTAGCAASPEDASVICTYNVSFTCSSSLCNNQMSFTANSFDETVTGCANDSNPQWNCPLTNISCALPGVKQILNYYFQIVMQQATGYDWSSSCQSPNNGSSSSANYTINATCFPQTCFINGQFCNNCVYLNGGPFGNPVCFDQDPSEVENICGQSATFTCSSFACNNQMSYSVFYYGETLNGCATDSNSIWNCPLGSQTCPYPGVLQYLNALYTLYTQGASTSYNWFSPCSSGLSVGAIIGIVIGIVVFIAIVIGLFVWYRRRSMVAKISFSQNTSRQVQLMQPGEVKTSRV